MSAASEIPEDARRAMLAQATSDTPIPPDVLARLVSVESGWNPSAKNKSTGASGLGQALPSTAADPGYGVPPLPAGASPQEQLDWSAKYLTARGRAAGLKGDDWKNPEKLQSALAAYHGPVRDANGVDGTDYARRVLGMSASDTAAALGAQSPAQALGATPYGPGMVSQVMQENAADRQRAQQQTAPLYEEVRKNYERDQAQFEKVASSYKPVQQTPPPTPPDNDPLKGFGSAASMFAMLASAFTHTPAVNAMNGMAAAINATKEGDQQAYAAAYKQWKDNTELAIQNHKLQADDMKTAMDMMQQNLSSGVAMAKAVAAQSQDSIASRLIDLGEYEKLDQHMQAKSQAADKMAETAPLVSASLNLMRAEKSGDPAAIAKAREEYAFAKSPTSAAEQPGSAQNQMKILIQDYMAHGKTQAEAIVLANKDLAASKSGSKPTPASVEKERDAETLAAAEFRQKNGRDPGPQDAAEMAQIRTNKRAEFKGDVSGERTIGTRSAGLGMAASELTHFAPMAIAASEKVDRTKYPTLNKLLEAAEQDSGDENVTRLAIAINGVKTAYAQVLKRGGVQTDDANRRSDEVMDKAWSNGQIKVAIDQMMKEVEAAKQAPIDARGDLEGGYSAPSAKAAPASQSSPSAPAVGAVEGGYRYKGGDPASPSSWEPAAAKGGRPYV